MTDPTTPQNMEDLSFDGFQRILQQDPQPVVLLVLGATEAHGPHLPLSTDTIIGHHLACLSAGRLGKEHDTMTLLAPAFITTAATCASGFPGTVSVTRETERAALSATVDACLDAGVRRLCLLTLHFDPDHLAAVQDVLESLGAKREHVVFPDFTKKENATKIGGEFATGDCHAGEFETSLMLVAAPHRVDESHKDLAPEKVGLVKGIREGKRSFRDLGMHEAYCGEPGRATKEEGQRLYGVLTDIVVESCRVHWVL